jgi:hypothetical protein
MTSIPKLMIFSMPIQAEHEQELVVTEHPVQSGASIADHAYLRPARLVLDVGMSDAMDAFFNPSTWTGAPTKSVSCYQTLLALQASRIPLQITTKLRTYQNMLIVNPFAQETKKTIAGLRVQISFQQIFMAKVVVPPASARPQDTNSTDLGQVNPQPPTSAQSSQNIIPYATVDLTAGSTTVTPTSLNGLSVGQSVNGDGIPNGATITAINTSAGTIELSQPATATTSGSTMNLYHPWNVIGAGQASSVNQNNLNFLPAK